MKKARPGSRIRNGSLLMGMRMRMRMCGRGPGQDRAGGWNSERRSALWEAVGGSGRGFVCYGRGFVVWAGPIGWGLRGKVVVGEVKRAFSPCTPVWSLEANQLLLWPHLPFPAASFPSPSICGVSASFSHGGGTVGTHTCPPPAHTRFSINVCSAHIWSPSTNPASASTVLRLDPPQGIERARVSPRPLPHEIGTGPGPPAALVHALDHGLRAVLHLAGHGPRHRVMAPVPVERIEVMSALSAPEDLEVRG